MENIKKNIYVKMGTINQQTDNPKVQPQFLTFGRNCLFIPIKYLKQYNN
jgi:hypothetical protein